MSADTPTPPSTPQPTPPSEPYPLPESPLPPEPSPPSEFVRLLRSQRVWDTELPDFDPAAAPAEPLPLFERWFAGAVAAGQTEPHTMSLATADADGLPDVRTVMLHGADEEGWHFASHAGSRKGRHLASRPYAALGFYWPAQGRQIRVRGPVTVAPPEVARADLRARSTGSLASALVGRQSEVLDSYEELERSSDAAWDRARREPDAPAPSWTVYVLDPDEVEFFQGDARRRHVRLTYRRTNGTAWRTWRRELLWP
ncbi:pyridoxamine 5'-phosphate oxidase [Streptomyces aurantiacus]|uniref:pyridoxine/pyridoxamine 5'-phosphate oxidase n=1 Tax=Streptomyces aurantiacus TaxID=47760 RepID=UPI0027943CBB|nr:pyridoxal 5'-phosphate synthase [Streptomyces aurantiacus]MDQ0775369.1 pyridoxamine 5'-phosphate oxidase [Streptomyces aurantiacus]